MEGFTGPEGTVFTRDPNTDIVRVQVQRTGEEPDAQVVEVEEVMEIPFPDVRAWVLQCLAARRMEQLAAAGPAELERMFLPAMDTDLLGFRAP